MPTSHAVAVTQPPPPPPPGRPQRLTCHAASPDDRRSGQECGRLLGFVPSSWRFVRVERHVDEHRPEPGCVYLLCTRNGCRQWNVYELPRAPLEPTA